MTGSPDRRSVDDGRDDHVDRSGIPPRSGRSRSWTVAVLGVGLIAAIAVAALIATASGSSARHAPPPPAPSAGERIDALLAGVPESGDALGSSSAPVTLQYFGDLQCPTSREFTLGALPFLVRRWVRPGLLRIEYRSLETATSSQQVFRTQQVAALAAGMQNKLWYYLELFYHDQQRENSGYVNEAFLRRLAAQTPALNTALWADDRYDPALGAQVASDAATAALEDMHSTPAFLVGSAGGRHLVRLTTFSPLEPGAFNLAIEQARAEAATPGRVGDATPPRQTDVVYRTPRARAGDRLGTC